jgi:hypothetical protein
LKELQRLPLKYLCLLFLYATEEKKDLLTKIRKWLAILIQIRRKYFRENRERLLKESEQKDKEENIRQSQEAQSVHVRSHYVKVITGLLPEYCTPYFIHLLAHHPYFEKDGPKYVQSVRYLSFFFEHITQGNNDNRNLIRQMLIDIKQTRDATALDSHNIHILAEIAYRILLEYYPIPVSSTTAATSTTAAIGHQEVETNTYLPESLYTLGPDNTLLPLKEYLPGWQLPSTNRLAQLLSEAPLPTTTTTTTTTTQPTPKKTKKGTENERTKNKEQAHLEREDAIDDNEDKENQELRFQELETEKEATPSPKKKTPKKSSKKTEKSSTTTSKEKQLPIKQTPTPKRNEK